MPGDVRAPENPAPRPAPFARYWGYATRFAAGFGDVARGCPWPGGYDLVLATSERGDDVSAPGFALPPFRHALVAFGGLSGLEAALAKATPRMTAANRGGGGGGGGSSGAAAAPPPLAVHAWLNTCNPQGSRTIRTEEALLVSLARLQPHVLRNTPPP